MRDRWNDGGFHPFAALLILLLIAAAIGLIIWLITSRRPHAPAVPAPPPAPLQPSPTASAEAILAERLARSEITPDDYRSMIAALREQPPPPATS